MSPFIEYHHVLTFFQNIFNATTAHTAINIFSNNTLNKLILSK